MLHRIDFHAMGSEILAIVEQESDQMPEKLMRVPEWFEEWEQVLSRFRYDSELTRLNQRADQPVQVSVTLWDVFQTAQIAHQTTDGLVTPTVLEALIEAGYDQTFESLLPYSNYETFPASRTAPDLSGVACNPTSKTITLPFGLGLDFGGVAKGWAAHQTMQRLQVDGPVLLDAAGDIALSGPCSDGSPWLIGVADPLHPDQDLEMLALYGGGVATSGKDHRRWLRNGQWQHHLIHPLTGLPAETDLLTATVIAPTMMEAEAAAKAVFILGSRLGMQWIESHPALTGLLVMEDGRISYSAGMEKYL
jgi:thiamine biosynthesis lipoprotein